MEYIAEDAVHECARCSNDFYDDELASYDGEILCHDCIDELIRENGSPHDL